MKRVRYSNQLRMGYLRKTLTAKSYPLREVQCKNNFFPSVRKHIRWLKFFLFWLFGFFSSFYHSKNK